MKRNASAEDEQQAKRQRISPPSSEAKILQLSSDEFLQIISFIDVVTAVQLKSSCKQLRNTFTSSYQIHTQLFHMALKYIPHHTIYHLDNEIEVTCTRATDLMNDLKNSKFDRELLKLNKKILEKKKQMEDLFTAEEEEEEGNDEKQIDLTKSEGSIGGSSLEEELKELINEKFALWYEYATKREGDWSEAKSLACVAAYVESHELYRRQTIMMETIVEWAMDRYDLDGFEDVVDTIVSQDIDSIHYDW